MHFRFRCYRTPTFRATRRLAAPAWRSFLLSAIREHPYGPPSLGAVRLLGHHAPAEAADNADRSLVGQAAVATGLDQLVELVGERFVAHGCAAHGCRPSGQSTIANSPAVLASVAPSCVARTCAGAAEVLQPLGRVDQQASIPRHPAQRGSKASNGHGDFPRLLMRTRAVNRRAGGDHPPFYKPREIPSRFGPCRAAFFVPGHRLSEPPPDFLTTAEPRETQATCGFRVAEAFFVSVLMDGLRTAKKSRRLCFREGRLSEATRHPLGATVFPGHPDAGTRALATGAHHGWRTQCATRDHPNATLAGESATHA